MHSNVFPATLPDLPQGVVVPADLSETDAYHLLAALTHRFGWANAVWDRQVMNDVLAHTMPTFGQTVPRTAERTVTDAEWARITATATWREHIASVAYDRVSEEDLLDAALTEAGLVCYECHTDLLDQPSVTGRLCDECRTGPAGQPAVVNPATEGLYWLDGDTLTYAPPDWEDKAPGFANAKPVDWAELDPLATYQAERAHEALTGMLAGQVNR